MAGWWKDVDMKLLLSGLRALDLTVSDEEKVVGDEKKERRLLVKRKLPISLWLVNC